MSDNAFLTIILAAIVGSMLGSGACYDMGFKGMSSALLGVTGLGFLLLSGAVEALRNRKKEREAAARGEGEP